MASKQATHLSVVPPLSSEGSPLQAGGQSIEEVMQGLLTQAAKDGASQALRDMRQERKLGRSDVGKASEAIAGILRKFRVGHGMTQRDLAKSSGLHPTTIGKIESAERGMSLTTFSRISQALEDEDFVWDVIAEVSVWE